jgi:hypothetical protein
LKEGRFLLDQDPTAPPEPLFKQLGWRSIEQRIKYHKYLLVSKCLKNEAPVYLKNKIKQHNNNQLKARYNLYKKVALNQDLNIS